MQTERGKGNRGGQWGFFWMNCSIGLGVGRRGWGRHMEEKRGDFIGFHLLHASNALPHHAPGFLPHHAATFLLEETLPSQVILDYLSQSADNDPSSPAEYLSTRSSRRTLIYLVLTLGHIYPDYDFSAVQAHLFFRVEEWDSFKQILDTYLFEAAKISVLLVSPPPPPPPTKKPIRLITSWYHLSESFLSSSSVEASIINLDSVGSRHLVRLHVSASRAR
ncbi:hypothetical protein KSP40_PGU000088 [Platanthera guangdongensis]|uniref:Uncharacterized protein n=1 Tax=Platanthera guangdongensis TaxID=2320717 RepID=A0ABR2M023_9ASPA